MPDQNPFDVAIIGTGPGGYVAAIRAAQLGLKTAVIERDSKFGGTCLLRGCIPTKALLHDAQLIQQIRQASRHGITCTELAVDFPKVIERKTEIVGRLAKGVEFLLRKNKITSFRGNGKIAAPGKVVVSGSGGSAEVSARNIIIATGSEPKPLPGYAIDGKFIMTNNEALDLQAVPKSLAIIGGGAVGVEFASVYSSFGSKVTLIEALPQIVPLEDEDCSKELKRVFGRQGIDVHTGARLESAQVQGSSVEVVFQTARSEVRKVSVDKMLMAVGRAPNTASIGLEAMGVANDRGFVKVDEFMRTSVPGIYAIGDIVPTPLLAHIASQEGIVAVEHIAGHSPRPIDYRKNPNCTYCIPQVASVGWTEAKAREAGHQIKVSKFPFTAVSKAVVEDATDGFVKIVADAKYGEILGVHMVGSIVTEMIAEAVAAMNLETTAEELVHTIHAHPTMAEGIHEAAEGIFGSPIHI